MTTRHEPGENHAQKSVGTARHIDQLGRIVVPAELRKLMNIHAGDLLDFRAVDGRIAIIKVDPECVICGQTEYLVERHGKHLCADCIGELRGAPECAICGRLADLVERHGKHVCADCVKELQHT
jgi:transcriptional pleiotropic regulator of transition state genes